MRCFCCFEYLSTFVSRICQLVMWSIWCYFYVFHRIEIRIRQVIESIFQTDQINLSRWIHMLTISVMKFEFLFWHIGFIRTEVLSPFKCLHIIWYFHDRYWSFQGTPFDVNSITSTLSYRMWFANVVVFLLCSWMIICDYKLHASNHFHTCPKSLLIVHYILFCFPWLRIRMLLNWCSRRQ